MTMDFLSNPLIGRGIGCWVKGSCRDCGYDDGYYAALCLLPRSPVMINHGLRALVRVLSESRCGWVTPQVYKQVFVASGSAFSIKGQVS